MPSLPEKPAVPPQHMQGETSSLGAEMGLPLGWKMAAAQQHMVVILLSKAVRDAVSCSATVRD